MRSLLLVLPFLLSGCAVFTGAPYVPFAVEITDPDAFKAAVLLCQGYAAQYRPGLSLEAIAEAGVTGALQNAPSATVAPLVPLISGIGGATTAVIQGLDLLGQNQRHIVIRCMDKKGDRTGKWLVLDPGI